MADTVLWLHFDGANNSTTVVDSSSYNRTQNGDANALIKTDQSKAGGSSFYNDGSRVVSYSSSSDFGFGTGDYTVEFYLYPLNVANTDYRNLVFFNLLDTEDDSFFQFYNSKPSIYWNSTTRYVGSNAITLNAWSHLALVRSSGTTTVYMNGVAQFSTTDVLDLGSSNRCYIGCNYYIWFGFRGYMDELRITKGTALYTEDFTPPEAPYSEPVEELFFIGSASLDWTTSATLTKKALASVATAELVTWDQSFSNLNIVYSNNYYTAQSVDNIADTRNTIRTTLARTAGKYYVEFYLDTYEDSLYSEIGLITVVTNNNEWMEWGEGFGLDRERMLYNSYGSTVDLSSQMNSFTTGDIVQLAVDFTTRKVWYGLNGTWVGNPSAGTGEALLIPVLSINPYYPAVCFDTEYGFGDKVIGRFLEAHFNHPIPTGFSAWDETNIVKALSLTATGTLAFILGKSLQELIGMHVLRSGTWEKQASYYYGLLTSIDPIIEVSDSQYARYQLVNADSSWSSVGGRFENLVSIQFPKMTTNCTIVGWAMFSNLFLTPLVVHAFDTPIEYVAHSIGPVFGKNQLAFTVL